MSLLESSYERGGTVGFLNHVRMFDSCREHSRQQRGSRDGGNLALNQRSVHADSELTHACGDTPGQRLGSEPLRDLVRLREGLLVIE